MKIDYSTDFTCVSCGKNKSGYRTRKNVCGYCLVRLWRKNNPDKAQAQDLKYGRLYRQNHHDEYKEYQKEYHKRWYKENRDRLKAKHIDKVD